MIWILSLLLILACAFVFIAAIGLLRMPDLYTRMHAATKAGAFGGSIILIVCIILYPSFAIGLKATLIILFFFTTAPIAAHMVCRAAYLKKTPTWSNTSIDDLKGKYDLKKQKLN